MRGVGDELALRLDHLLGLGARGVELAEHLLQRPRQLADLVVALGLGMRSEGSRVVAISRAAAVSEEIGRIARPATAIPASAASSVPPSTPPARNSHSLLMVAVERVALACVLDELRPGRVREREQAERDDVEVAD